MQNTFNPRPFKTVCTPHLSVHNFPLAPIRNAAGPSRPTTERERNTHAYTPGYVSPLPPIYYRAPPPFSCGRAPSSSSLPPPLSFGCGWREGE